MSWKLIDKDDHGARTYVLVADPGEEAIQALTSLARDEQLDAAQLTAVGAFARATVGWFDREHKEYRKIAIDEQCEVLSLVGDVALGEDGPVVHAHAVLGLQEGDVRGGHLLDGEVWPTLEVVVRESPATLRKTDYPEIGLALIDLDRASPASSAATARNTRVRVEHQKDEGERSAVAGQSAQVKNERRTKP